MITSDFAAYAVLIDVHFRQPVPSPVIQERVEALLSKIAKECVKAGADLIGHIKCIVETSGKGFLAVSVTEAGGKPSSRGHLEEGIEQIDVVINVLLYGLSRKEIQEVVDPLARMEMLLPGAEVEVEDLEKPHDHGHDHEHGHH